MSKSVTGGRKDIECAADTIDIQLDTYFSCIGSGANPLMPIMQNQYDNIKAENPSDLRK